jgi:hypothetical protein
MTGREGALYVLTRRATNIPIDGELLPVALLEEQAGVELRSAP